MKRIKIFCWVVLFGVAACEKVGQAPYTRFVQPVADSTGDIRAVLAGSSFHLFQQAAVRAGLDTLLQASGEYTIFAPADSAMQSAGLTASAIDSLPVDTLQKIVLYHVTRGVYSPAALEASISSIQAPTMRQDLSYNNQLAQVYIYQQSLFLKITGSLYVNGEAAGNAGDSILAATNGYVYPVNAVLQAPTQTLWEVLEGRPELSMYLAGMRLDDSIYNAYGWMPPLTQQFNVIYADSLIFGNVYYVNQAAGNPGTMYTVFAPTNDAFAAAGFHTVDDLRAYALSAGFIGIPQYSSTFYYTPLDSVLKQQVIGNIQYSFTNLSLYNDLLYNPDINSGEFNVFDPYQAREAGNGGAPQEYLCHVHPLFFNKNNEVYIQWSDSSNVPQAPVPADRSRHFMALDGVVYETDQLFYPHN